MTFVLRRIGCELASNRVVALEDLDEAELETLRATRARRVAVYEDWSATLEKVRRNRRRGVEQDGRAASLLRSP